MADLERVYYLKPDLDEVHGPRGKIQVYGEGLVDDSMRVDTVEASNLVSSEVHDPDGLWTDEFCRPADDGESLHALAIDLDVPARLVPSSTPGHTHLFIDVPMSWGVYQEILGVLAYAGILEDGYVEASASQGKTLLRTKPRPVEAPATEEKF